MNFSTFCLFHALICSQSLKVKPVCFEIHVFECNIALVLTVSLFFCFVMICDSMLSQEV